MAMTLWQSAYFGIRKFEVSRINFSQPIQAFPRIVEKLGSANSKTDSLFPIGFYSIPWGNLVYTFSGISFQYFGGCYHGISPMDDFIKGRFTFDGISDFPWKKLGYRHFR